MYAAEEIRKELDKLVNDSDAIFKHIRGDNADIAFINSYQNWYTRAIKLTSLLGKDRLGEFCDYYRINPNRDHLDSTTYVIQDYVSGCVLPAITAESVRRGTSFVPSDVIKSKYAAQIGILKSLSTRIDSILSDVKGHLFAELQDEELKVASQLVEINLRAAGAVAGVIIERHLQRVLVNHCINISKKNPNISDLNNSLKENSVYDIATWRKIQYLADIRNYCDHHKDREPTKEEVNELIAGVDSGIKTIF